MSDVCRRPEHARATAVDDDHPGIACDLGGSRLDAAASRSAVEPHSADAEVDAFTHCCESPRRCRTDDDTIDLARNRGQVGKGSVTLHGYSVRVDRKHFVVAVAQTLVDDRIMVPMLKLTGNVPRRV